MLEAFFLCWKVIVQTDLLSQECILKDEWDRSYCSAIPWEQMQRRSPQITCGVPFINTEWVSWEGTTAGHPVQPTCSHRVPWNMLLKIVSRQLLSISREDLHSLSGPLVSVLSHPQQKVLHFQVELCVHQFLPVPPVPFLSTREQSLLHALTPPCRQ